MKEEELVLILKECMRNFGIENQYTDEELENLEGYAYDYIEKKGVSNLLNRLNHDKTR